MIKTLSFNHRVYNLYTKFVKILEICKQFSENLVNESGNVPRRGHIPKFSDLEVVALSLTAETESIDNEKWLFDYKLQECKDCIHNPISRRQLFAKIIGKISALTILQYINFINNKPIGRIKYALN